MSEFNIVIESGKSKRLLTAGKYCEDNIVVIAESGDTELPELTNAGSAADLLTGKQLIDGDGNVVAGTMPTLTSLGQYTPNASIAKNGVYFDISGPLYGQGYVSHPSGKLTVYGGQFGQATTAQVFKGATFTSSEGVNITGTYEPSYELYGSQIMYPEEIADRDIPSTATYINLEEDEVYGYFYNGTGYDYKKIRQISFYDITGDIAIEDIDYSVRLMYSPNTGWSAVEFTDFVNFHEFPDERYRIIDFKNVKSLSQEEYQLMTGIIANNMDTSFDMGNAIGFARGADEGYNIGYNVGYAEGSSASPSLPRAEGTLF